MKNQRPELDGNDVALESGFEEYWGDKTSLAAKRGHRHAWVAARRAQAWADFDHWFGSYCRNVYSHRETRHAAYLKTWEESIRTYKPRVEE